jgi:opacity protein-like surface antigen
MRISRLTPALFLALVFAHAGLAHAQGGAIANAGVGIVAAGDGGTSLAISGGVGYRFNRSIGFGIELTHTPGLDSGLTGGVIRPLGIAIDGFDDEPEGHATIFTTNVRVEIPTAMRRVIPYVAGGGGIAAVTQPYPVYYALAAGGTVGANGSVQYTSSSSSLPVPASAIYPPIYPAPQFISSTTVAMALTLGGGASVLVTDHLAIDIDLRAFQLVSDTGGRTMGRFGVGTSYRF